MSGISGPAGRPVPFDASHAEAAAAAEIEAQRSAAQAPGASASAAARPAAVPAESRMDVVGRTLGAAKPAAPAPTRPNSPNADKAILCPVLGAMVNEGKIKLDAKGNMSLFDFQSMLVKDMHFSRPLAIMTASAGVVANRPIDILGNLFGARMNPLELRGGMVHHPGDSMILTKGTFDEEKFQALARHATDAKVVNGKVVSGRLTLQDMTEVVAANVARDAAVSGKKQGATLGIAEMGAVVAMFGERNPRTGEREISVETLRALYADKKLPKPAGTAAEPTTFGAYRATMAEMTRRLPGASATGIATDGARAAAGLDASAMTPAMLGAAKGVCPHVQGTSSASAPVSAAELRAIAGLQ